MNIYFTTCNPNNYNLKENWNDNNKRILWGYGNDPDGKFKGSEVNDCVLLMYNDKKNNNKGDTLYHCVIEDGIKEFDSVEKYFANEVDGKYVLRRDKSKPLRFYNLKIIAKTERIRKQEIIETQNPDDPILVYIENDQKWNYYQGPKKLSDRKYKYLKCSFTDLLLSCSEELELNDDEINIIRECASINDDSVAVNHQTKKAEEKTQNKKVNKPRNLIVFGAPGTGKSYYLNTEIESFDKVERVTFYPSYSYSQFVGCYKPTMKGENIAYSFVPGPFLKTYVDAIKDFSKNYLLIIEEINRADAASVFGDVFQLLDRDEEGKSVYSISASEDIKKYLEGEKISSGKLSIPSNMYIWATMNSADQGVFPMDTAFKRRWDFLYFNLDGKPIEDEDDCPVSKNNWESIRIEINKWLCEKKVNEDKLLGKYFINAGENVTEKDFRYAFKNKVLMYLYEDAARAYRSELFEKNSFSEILSDFNENGTDIFRPGKINSIAKREDNKERTTEE